MYKTFSIENFRGFQNFEFDKLKQITLVGGKNNVGKSSLLEALFIHSGQTNGELLLRVNSWRKILLPSVIETNRIGQTLLGPLFYNFDLSTPIVFQSVTKNGIRLRSEIRAIAQPSDIETILPTSKTSYRITGEDILIKLCSIIFKENNKSSQKHELVLTRRGDAIGVKVEPPFKQVSFLTNYLFEGFAAEPSADATMFSNFRQDKRETLILQGAQAIDESIRKLEVLSPAGAPIIYATLKPDRLFPLTILGHGISRLIHILLTIGQSAGGVVLIDEIGYGLHYSVLPDVWKVIGSAARTFDVQIIANTHSFETIIAAHKAFQKAKQYDSFGYFRLDRENGQIGVTYVDENALQLAVDAGFEIR